MRNVFIKPTMETSLGTDDKYDIVDIDTGDDIHMSIKKSDLKDIIEVNDYLVIDGSKYL